MVRVGGLLPRDGDDRPLELDRVGVDKSRILVFEGIVELRALPELVVRGNHPSCRSRDLRILDLFMVFPRAIQVAAYRFENIGR